MSSQSGPSHPSPRSHDPGRRPLHSWLLVLAMASTAPLLAGCDSVFSGSDWSVRIGTLADEPDGSAIEVPDAVTEGERFTVRVLTTGGGCDRAAGTQVGTEDGAITVTPTDSIYVGGGACPAVVRTFEHETTLSLAVPDPATIRFRVRSPTEDRLITVDRTVEVEARPFLLAASFPRNTTPDALFQGMIEADGEGCLRVVSGEPATVLWPLGFTLTERAGSHRILDGTGAEVGALGIDTFRLGGGFVSFLDEGSGLSAADRQVARERCPGSYWLVSDVLADGGWAETSP